MKRALFLSLAITTLTALGGTAQAEIRFANTGDKPDEWAAWSCEDRNRWSQTAPFQFGVDPQRYYWINLFDGDDSYGERCELGMGNTSASNIRRVGGPRALFHQGDDLYIGFKYRLMPGFAFCTSCASVPNEGGLIQQIKQLGSCGTPALGVVVTRTGAVVRNSDTADCSGGMHTITSWTGDPYRTNYVLQRVVFSTNPSIGRVDTYADVGDGNGMVLRGAVQTHTQKSPTDHPAGACEESTPCSHLRVGLYRNPNITGRSIIRQDNAVSATTRAEAEAVLYGP